MIVACCKGFADALAVDGDPVWSVGVRDRGRGQVLDKRALLQRETFWQNRDWDWYQQNIPVFECPDTDITTTWYYRWELLTRHLTYGSPNSGYSFTEFTDRPFWSGAYGAISCPAGHQLYEARWLLSPQVANDYSRYWFRTPALSRATTARGWRMPSGRCMRCILTRHFCGTCCLN